MSGESPMLIQHVRAYCLTHHLFEPGPVVVAVSGGADSLTLLRVLLALREELGVALHVATFDHGIRGEESAADCRFVCEVARAWDVPVTAGAADVPALAREWSMGVETAARKARYSFLAEVARRIGARQIAVGHNRDDQAETVLMHVIRGAGLAGLRGMLPRAPLGGSNLIIVRPLLETPRAEIDAYLHDLGIQPRIDRTNADTAYIRNRLRHDVIPLLEMINPQVRQALARTGELAREDYDALQGCLSPLQAIGTGVAIGRAELLAMPPAQQRLLIRLAAQQLSPGLELSFEQTIAAVSLISAHSHGARMPLGADVWLKVTNDLVSLFDETSYPADCPWMEPGSSLIITQEGAFKLPGGGWQLKAKFLPNPSPMGDDPLSAQLAIPNSEKIEIRTRKAGDRFRPHGLGGYSQKLSDTLINMKSPARWRDRIPLLTVGGEISWFVAPLLDGPRPRIAESFAIRQDEQQPELRPIWRFSFLPVEIAR
jgi:tRNA(Ile)-lysidine synthase